MLKGSILTVKHNKCRPDWERPYISRGCRFWIKTVFVQKKSIIWMVPTEWHTIGLTCGGIPKDWAHLRIELLPHSLGAYHSTVPFN